MGAMTSCQNCCGPQAHNLDLTSDGTSKQNSVRGSQRKKQSGNPNIEVNFKVEISKIRELLPSRSSRCRSAEP